MKKIMIFIMCAVAFFPALTFAQELHNDHQGTHRAKVVNIISEEVIPLPARESSYTLQTFEAKILSGPNEGETIEMRSDYLVFDVGNKFYFNYTVDINGTERYTPLNMDRRGGLIVLVAIFILAVVAFGRWQGVRSLVALAGSFAAIGLVLIPGILNGWNPLLASFLVAAGVLFFAIFLTHGFNRESAVAFFGTMTAVLITGLFAIFAVDMTHLSGFAAEESVYLNFNTGGTINFTALLLGAFIIGFLGVLDDIAVTQAAVVTELYTSNPNITRREVYKRAMRIGREHVGALVNTLVLAYTGASLPLLLFFYLTPTPFITTINLEVFATEIVRIIVGSIGLILTVPIVTLLAVYYLKGYVSKHEGGHSHGHK